MSLRTALDSGWLYFAGAAVLLLAAALSLIQYNPQTERPVGSLAELSQLADRDDLNVVLIVIDMLRADLSALKSMLSSGDVR